jgi:hypothetical protein
VPNNLDQENFSHSGSEALRVEIHAVLRRYGQESDVTIAEVLGVLELVKQDLLAMCQSSR